MPPEQRQRISHQFIFFGLGKINLVAVTVHQMFFYFIDIDSFNVGQLYYYFSVTDNDALNGFKLSKTAVFQFIPPSKKALKEITKEKSSEIKDQINQLKKEVLNKLDDMKNLKNILYKS